MKYILIFIFLLASIQIYAQSLYVESGASIYIEGTSYIDGNVSANTPTLYAKGNVENTGTVYNNGEIQLNANFVNTGTFSSIGEEAFVGNITQNLLGNFISGNKFNHVLIDKMANKVVVGANIEIGTSLSLFNGKLDLTNFDATMNAGANTTGATNASYVMTSGTGNLKQTVSNANVLFPVGNTSYNPITIANSGTTDVFAARVADQVNCAGGNLWTSTAKVNRTWYLTENIAGGSNATITTQWNTADEAANFNRNLSGISAFNSGEFQLAQTNNAAANVSANVWTQTQTAQTNISPRLVTSISPLTGGGVSFCENGITILTAQADANATYQWQKNGVDISLANAQTYTATDSGLYSVVMTSGNCLIKSNETPLKMLSISTASIPFTDGILHNATHECTDAVTNWTHYFDASPIAGSYLLLSVKKNGNTNLGTVPTTATVFVDGEAEGATTIASPFVQNISGWTVMSRYWKFIPQNEPTINVDVRFYFTKADVDSVKALSGNPAIEADSMYFYKINDVVSNYDPNPANGQMSIPLASSFDQDGIWVYVPTVMASATSWKHELVGLEAHSAEFKVGHFGGGGGGGTNDNNPPFPLKLLSFRGYNEGARNRLFWTTETELNVDKFKVERSAENGVFQEVGEVKAVGNSNKQENYAFNDNTFKANQNFYRLKMIDNNGTFSYSNIIEIATNKFNITIYPNPAQSEVFVSGSFTPNSTASIMNMLGQEVLRMNLDVQNQTTIPLQSISEGVYMLNILNEKGTIMYSEKLMKE